jgi:hypothetical protein
VADPSSTGPNRDDPGDPASTREPHAATARLDGEMPVPNADHDRHDQLLIASLLDRSTGGEDRDRGEALVATCADCAALHADLILLHEAARAVPTPPRQRDYRLSTEDAAQLRRTGWRQVVAAFGSTRDAFSRPLAIGLTTLGLAGLLAASIPGVLSGGAGSTAAVPTVGQAASGAGVGPESVGEPKAAPAPSAAPSVAAPLGAAQIAPSAQPTTAPAPAAASPVSSDESFDTFVGAPAATAGPAAIAPNSGGAEQREGFDATGSSATGEQATAPVDRVAVIVLAGLLLVAGVGLFMLRWAGRRV